MYGAILDDSRGTLWRKRQGDPRGGWEVGCLDSDHEGNALKRLRSQTSAVFGVRNSAEVSDFCRGKAAEWCLEHGRGLRTRL